MLQAALPMLKGCSLAVSKDAPLSSGTSFNQGTLAMIPTVNTATQCALTLLISSSSQTEGVPVLEGDDTLSGALDAGPLTCTCLPHSGHTGGKMD
ncbi:uncharacterized protein LOC144158604 isoform X3 [Haemaphysalis longicornis]